MTPLFFCCRFFIKPSLSFVHLNSECSNTRPSPSSKNSHFQNKAKCETFLLKMSFNLHEKQSRPRALRRIDQERIPKPVSTGVENAREEKIIFCVNAFALSLALNQRLGATLKWPIQQ